MKKGPLALLIFFIVLFIGIRSLHFVSSLNFASDQGIFSTKALEIYKNRELLLIGPTFSLNIDGRYAFQGSVIYYFQLFFLLLGGFDPVKASYAFMVFCSLMIIPLYVGTKYLISKQAAILMVIIYTLFPFYITYTKFLWNPNFQFSLLPLMVLFMGLHQKTRQFRYLFAVAFLDGIVVQFHYQLAFIIFLQVIYYFIASQKRILTSIIFVSGLIVGFSPILIFELRHDFYNFNTVLFFLGHRKTLGNNPLTSPQDYYFLNLSFWGLLAMTALLKNFRIPLRAIFLVLLFTSLLLFLPTPSHGFRMVEGWRYQDELKVHQIIMAENLNNYNIANVVYDTKANSQKYLLKKDNVKINFEDYYTNKYLFIMSRGDNYLKSLSYEVALFKPSRIIKQWKINDYVDLYLAERTP